MEVVVVVLLLLVLLIAVVVFTAIACDVLFGSYGLFHDEFEEWKARRLKRRGDSDDSRPSDMFQQQFVMGEDGEFKAMPRRRLSVGEANKICESKEAAQGEE